MVRRPTVTNQIDVTQSLFSRNDFGCDTVCSASSNDARPERLRNNGTCWPGGAGKYETVYVALLTWWCENDTGLDARFCGCPLIWMSLKYASQRNHLRKAWLCRTRRDWAKCFWQSARPINWSCPFSEMGPSVPRFMSWVSSSWALHSITEFALQRTAVAKKKKACWLAKRWLGRPELSAHLVWQPRGVSDG